MAVVPSTSQKARPKCENVSLIDLPHAALAEQGRDLIMAQGLAGHEEVSSTFDRRLDAIMRDQEGALIPAEIGFEGNRFSAREYDKNDLFIRTKIGE